jgi:hypothetical protein
LVSPLIFFPLSLKGYRGGSLFLILGGSYTSVDLISYVSDIQL